MKKSRIEIIENATLYLGDCLEILPTLGRVDAVVTDPPYGNQTLRSEGSNNRLRVYDLFIDDRQYIEKVVIPAVSKCLSMSTRAAITPGNHNFSLYPEPFDIGCFWMGASASWSRWGLTSMQPIYFYGKDPRQGKGQSPTGYTLREAAEKSEHPCPKPTRAWAWLVNKASIEGETVLDPFMGSGTTGVACANLGRKFIGIEIVPKYFDIACHRIASAYKQPWRYNKRHTLFSEYEEEDK